MAANMYSVLTEAYKETYDNVVRIEFEASAPLFSRIEKTAQHIGGKYFLIGAQTQGNFGGIAMAGAEDSELPASGQMAFVNPKIEVKTFVTTLQLSEKAIALSEGGKPEAFVNMLDFATRDMMTAAKWDINRQMWGDGTGAMAWFEGDPGGPVTTANVDDGQGNHHHWCKPGMIVQAFEPGDQQPLSATTVTLDSSTTMEALGFASSSGFSGAADSDYVIRTGSNNGAVGTAATAWYEIAGMKWIVSSDAYDPQNLAPAMANYPEFQNIDRGDYTFNNANYLANGGTQRPVDYNILMEAINATEANDGKVTAAYMNYPLERAISNLDIGNKQYGDKVEYEGGFRCVRYMGIPFFIEKHCQRNRIYFVDESTISMFHVKPIGLWDRPGSTWRTVLSTANPGYYLAQIQANIVYFCNMGCFEPYKNTVLVDLEESTTEEITIHV